MMAEELPQPIASEFRYCYEQHSLGLPLEKAMTSMAERAGSTDFAFFVTAVLGIVGALLATFLGQALGMYAAGQAAGFIASVIGAMIVLALYHMIRGRRRVL